MVLAHDGVTAYSFVMRVNVRMTHELLRFMMTYARVRSSTAPEAPAAATMTVAEPWSLTSSLFLPLSIARIACQFLNLTPSLSFLFVFLDIALVKGVRKNERRLLWHPSLADPSTVKNCDNAGDVVVICDCVQSREREWLNRSWGMLKRRRAVPIFPQSFKLQHFCFSSKHCLFGHTPVCLTVNRLTVNCLTVNCLTVNCLTVNSLLLTGSIVFNKRRKHGSTE